MVISIGSTELGMLAQLVVHSPIKGIGKYNGKLTTYICCIVSTIDLFNFFYAPQSTIDVFVLGFQSLNTCSSLVLLNVITRTSIMLTEGVTILTLAFGLNFIIEPPLSPCLHFTKSWAICQFVTHYSAYMARVV